MPPVRTDFTQRGGCITALPTMPFLVVTPRALQPLPHPHAHALWNSCFCGGEMSNGENIFLSHRNLYLSLCSTALLSLTAFCAASRPMGISRRV